MANIQTFLNVHGFEFRTHLDDRETQKVCVGIYDKEDGELCNLVRMLVEPNDFFEEEEGGIAIWTCDVVEGEKLTEAESRVFKSMFSSIYEVGASTEERRQTLCMKVVGNNKEVVIDRTLEAVSLSLLGEL